MKKLLIVALGTTFLLAGCTAADVTGTFDAIQKKAVSICGYVPAISMIGGIIGTFAGGPAAAATAGGIELVAKQACNMLTTKKMGLIDEGIPVEGWKVR